MARRTEDLKAVIRRASKDTGRAPERGFHAKAHGGGQCVLTILGRVPGEFRYGLFAELGAHQGFYRLSNGLLPWARNASDALPDVRGLAIKVMRAQAGDLWTGERAATQDFNGTNIRPFARDGGQFVAFAEATAEFASALVRLTRWGRKLGPPGAAVGALLGAAWGTARMLCSYLANPDVAQGVPRRALETARMLGTILIKTARPVRSLGAEEYEVAAVQIGPRVARLVIAPSAELSSRLVKGWKPLSRDYLRENWIENRKRGPMRFDLVLLPYRNERDTPLEDAHVGWKTEHIKVGELVVPALGGLNEEAAQEALVEQMAFQPWHTFKANSRRELAAADTEGRGAQGHTPRGQIQRERFGAYSASAELRGAGPERGGNAAARSS
ncbi:MAG TPA: hypothetical protein VFO18_05370 [Methylomirabilota bacterium]|nr:hypothetical protein [Methylomirabilota bacterium]